MIEKIGLYWHFVDLVWVFVFMAFYFFSRIIQLQKIFELINKINMETRVADKIIIW